ncbi:MAG: Gfo/Idh/MocA family protein [Phycisphaerales bacterium]
MKVAIVGAGFLARTRARCWKRVFGHAFEVVVAARDRAKAEAFAREHALSGACTVDEALADRSVVLVDLCVPNHAHRALCERAAAAGKHVLCTKPLAAFWGQGLAAAASAAAVAQVDRGTMLARACDDADAMVAACAKAGVRLFYGENWCFAPSIVRAAALARASGGAIVEMRGWESHSGSHSPYAKDWRHAGGGALLRLGAHPVGAMLWLKRGAARVASVTAEVRAEGAAPESWGSCTLKFDDGSVGVAFGSDHMLGGMQSHLTVLSPAFRFECALSPIDTLRAYAPRDGAFGGEYIMEKVDGQAGWSTPIPDEDWSSGQQGLVQSVAESLALGREPACDGALGAEVVRVIYAAYQSAASGRRMSV